VTIIDRFDRVMISGETGRKDLKLVIKFLLRLNQPRESVRTTRFEIIIRGKIWLKQEVQV
jgi:hypothetical protein